MTGKHYLYLQSCSMKIHFIAIGGSAMHSLAIALRKMGHELSGSDDEIFDPARSNLQKYDLLPPCLGWFPEKITPDLDYVVLGMHAHADNPELLKAKQLNLPIKSYPEILYEFSKNKTRIAIAGSHGKTTTTAMLIHTFRQLQQPLDFMVGSPLEGIENMVQFSDAPYMLIEADEYLTSTLQPIPKFHFYRPHIAVITGIAWDHFNVFKTQAEYVTTFEKFLETIQPHGKVIYCNDDLTLRSVIQSCPRKDLQYLPYSLSPYEIKNGKLVIKEETEEYTFHFMGEHNLYNLEAATKVAMECGIEKKEILRVLQSFKGAKGRMEKIWEDEKLTVIKDFAHAPSKVKATVEAVRKFYPDKALVAILELHTYSSLNKDFIPQYRHTLDQANEAIVFYNPHTFEIKRLPFLSPDQVREAFSLPSLHIFHDTLSLQQHLAALDKNKRYVWLFMSSGTFGGLDLIKLIKNNETILPECRK